MVRQTRTPVGSGQSTWSLLTHHASLSSNEMEHPRKGEGVDEDGECVWICSFVYVQIFLWCFNHELELGKRDASNTRNPLDNSGFSKLWGSPASMNQQGKHPKPNNRQSKRVLK